MSLVVIDNSSPCFHSLKVPPISSHHLQTQALLVFELKHITGATVCGGTLAATGAGATGSTGGIVQ